MGFPVFSDNVRQSYWDIDRGGTSSSGGSEIGFRSEILRSATRPSTTTHPYLNWSSERWSFGTTEQYPALRYYDNTCNTNTPSANCGNLLPRQRLGLRDLRFTQTGGSGQLQITPPFDGAVIKNDFDQLAVENYAVLMDSNISSIEVSAIAADAIGTITINDSPMSAGSADYTFVSDFPNVRTLNILVSQPNEITGKENLDVEYRLTFSTVPEINAITRTVAENENGAPLADSVAIREGHLITLSGELNDIDGDDLSYQWTVDETQVLLLDRATLRGDVVGGSGNAMLSFYLREDFIAADRDSETVNISLTVRDPGGATALREQSLVVNKFDNGAIDSITTPTRVGLTYTAPPLSRVQLAEDPDGAGNPNNIRYQWQRQLGGIWSDVVGANLASYTADGAIADRYRVIINYRDGQGYRSDIVSAPIEAAVEFVQEVVPTSEGSGFEVLLDADGLTPQFERTQTEYAVPPETDSIDIVVITRSEDVFINNVRLEGRVTNIDLDYGNNPIVVESRDEDNTSRNYTILREYDVSLSRWSVEWQGSPNNLDFDGTDLQPDPPVRIPNDIDTITVTARVNALIDIAIRSKGNTVGSITTSTEAGELVARATISNLALGEHDIEFFLSSPDGQSTASHVAKVWHRYNSQLRSLSADRLHPEFNPGQFEYSATISNHEEATTIFFEANEGGTVFVRNNPVAVSNPITGLRIGRNPERIRVTAPGVPDEEETIYEIIFNREYTLDLRSLSLSDPQMNVVNLSPAFSPTSHTYTTIVPAETSRVIVTFATDLEVGSSVQASNMPTVTDTTIRNNNVQDRIEKTASLPLSFDENTLVITTSALGEQQATTLTVTRLKSANARLQSLQLRDASNTDLLAGIFAPDTLSYDIDVANNTTLSTLILQPQDDKVTSITLNDVPLSLSSLQDTGLITRALPRFIVGDNEIKLKIIAHNEVSSQTYTLTVNREASSNANLDGFQVTPFSEGVPQAPVSPQNFAANTLFYTLPDQENEIDCIRVTPAAADSEATIEITKSGDTPEENYFVGKNNGESSECINLDVGDNTISVRLTATNKTTIRTYTIDIARKANSNKNLSGPPVVSGTSATRVLGTNNYTATLAINARSFVVSAMAEHPNATVLLTSGGVSVGPGRDALLFVTGISITNPEAQVTIVVTAEDDTMQTYTLTVELDVNDNASLASLTVAGTAAVRQSDGSYTANVSENTTNVSVTAVAGDANATVAIKEDGNTLESAMTSATSSVRLAETGDTKTLEIELTAQDVRVSESSTLTIVRAQSSNDCLASLAILNSADNSRASNTTLSGCNDTSPSLNIDNSVAQILIQVTAQNSRADIRVYVPGDSDGEQIQSGASNTETVAVPEGGATTITIVVTAQNGMTNREYIVEVRRAASSDNNLRDLQLLDVNDVNLLTFATEQGIYDIGVSNASNRATVSAEAHPQAKIKLRIDGEEDIATGTGMISSEFELPGTGAANRIRVRVVVTAQDESTTRGYTVFVTRADPVRTNADLGTIGFEVDRDRDGTYESLQVAVTPPEDGSTTHLARIRGIAGLEVQNIIRIRVLPRAFDGAATVSINNGTAMSAPSLDLMLTAALDTAEAPITIKVIAGDGVTSATYSLLITRESSSDTGLSSLTVGGTALQLNDATTAYTAAIAENVMTTDINARTRHSQATLVIREQGDTQTQDSRQESITRSVSIADTGGSKTFDIVVTAQNPSITRTYTLEVSRDPSTDVGLKHITVNGNAATRNDDGTYTASIGENTTKTRVIVESSSPKATVAITLDGVTNSATSRASREFAIDDPGATEQLQIRITAQADDTAPQDYTLTVRRDLSTDARLSRLELLPQPPGGVDAVIFDSLASTIEHEFPNTIDRIKIRPTAHPFANKVEMFRAGSSVGEIIAKGAESSDIALALGETTTITIVVTAQDTTAAVETYIVVLERAYTLDLRNLSLSDLQMNVVALMPAFASTRHSYDAVVPVETSEVTVTFETDLEVRSSVQALRTPTVTERTIRNNDVDDRIEKIASLPLSFGRNTLVIITSALGEQQATTLTVTRLRSTNAKLQSLQLRDPSNIDLLAGIFTPDTINYDIDVANNMNNIPEMTLILAPQDDKVSSITLNDVPLSLSSLQNIGLISRTLPPFIVGENEIELKIIAQDKISSQTYTVTVNRAASSNANLDGFQITPVSGGVLQTPVSPQNFAADTLSYTLPEQGNEIDCVRVTPAAADDEATIEITKREDTSEENYFSGRGNRGISDCIDLDIGSNTILVKLIATDKTTIRTYTIDIARRANSNKNLSAPPTVSGVAATQVPGTNNYTATLDANATSFSVSAMAEHSTAKVLIRTSDGVESISSRTASLDSVGISIAEPEEQIRIIVTAQDETSQTYTLTVSLELSEDVSLASLTVAGTAAVRQSDGTYTANVGENVADVLVAAVAGDSSATVVIRENGTTLASAMTSATSSIRLAETGDTKTLIIEVMAQDIRVSDSYTLTITRAQSSNDCLASLTILNSADNSRASSTTFNSSCDDQPSNPTATLNIDNSVAQILIRTTAQNSRANIRVHVPGDSDGEQVQSGASNTKAVAIPEGSATTITIVVTAQNGMANREYTVGVRRAASSDADLVDLQLLNVSDVNQLDFATEQEPYNIKVSNASNRAAVIAEAHPQAKIKLHIDGVADITTATGTISSEFELRETGTENRVRVRIVVTAQDDITTRGYTVFVTRANPIRTNADLDTIEFEVDRDGTYESLPVVLTSPEEGSTTYSAVIRGTVGVLEVQNIIDIRVSPQASDGAATVSINGAVATSAPSLDFMLDAALDATEEPVSIKVIAGDGVTSRTYSLLITRESSSDTALSVSPVGGVEIQLNDTTTKHTITLDQNVMTIDIDLRTRHSQATLVTREQGDTATQGRGQRSVITSVSIADTGGSKTLEIIVTAQNPSISQTYILEVNRAPSTDVRLKGITVNGNDATRNDDGTYTANIGENTENVSVIVESNSPKATVAITLDEVTNSATSRTITEFTIDDPGASEELGIRITAQDPDTAPQDYTLTVRRDPSTDANLLRLELLPQPPSRVDPVIFDSPANTIRQGFSNAVGSVTIKPTAHPLANKVEMFRAGSSAGEVIRKGTESSEIVLASGKTTTITIVVTAQDENTTQGYTVFVTRADPLGTNVGLGMIEFEVDRNRDGTYTSLPVALTLPEQGSTIYSAIIRGITGLEVQNINRIRVSPRASDNASTVSINGGAAMSAPRLDLMLAAALDTAEEPISIKVIAEDGMTSATYSLLITRESSSDTGLSSLTVGGIALQLNDATTEYTATIAENVMTTDINARTRHSSATLVIREQGDTSTQDSGQRDVTESVSIADTGDSKTLEVIVTAQNRSISRTYTLQVSRDPSTNADLKSITVNGNAATENDDGTYTANISENTENVSVIVESSSTKAMVAVTLDRVTNSATSRTITEFTIDEPGANEQLQIRITAQADGTAPQDYTLTVSRDPSTDARLSRLELLPQPPGGVDAVIFDSPADEIRHEFPNTVGGVTIKPTAHPFANKVEMFRAGSSAGEIIAKDAESSEIALTPGETTTITIVVTAQDITAPMVTYTVILERAYTLDLRNLSLSDLQMDMIALMPAFASTRHRYAAEVPAETTQVRVTFATDLEVESSVQASRTPIVTETTIRNHNVDDRIEKTVSLPLSFGVNTLVITTSALGEQQVTTLTITRLKSANARLQSLQLLDTSDTDLLAGTFSPTSLSYVVVVANDDNFITLILEPQDKNVFSVTLDNVPLSLSNLKTTGLVTSAPHRLMLGENRIELKIIAHDEMSSQTYTLIVNPCGKFQRQLG